MRGVYFDRWKVRLTPGVLLLATAVEAGPRETCAWSSLWQRARTKTSVYDAVKAHPPRKLLHVEPTWPTDDVGRRGRGMPIVEAVIDVNGKVEGARFIRKAKFEPAWPELDDALLRAVQQWEYEPFVLDGKPSPVCLVVTVTIDWR